MYGPTDFLANCGGLLGLFLGVSVISIVEIFYFCTIRIYFNLRNLESHQQIIFVEMISKSQTKPNCLKIVKKLIADYSTKTTIQGINYVADNDRSLTERLWWVIVIVISMFCCGSLISDVFERYEQSPIIINYENEETLATAVKNSYLYLKCLHLNLCIFSRFRFQPLLFAHK
jgi:hypothetical protein